MDNQQGPAVRHRELCSMLCGSLVGRGAWGRMNTCVGMAEHSAVHLKLPQQCYPSILQYNIKNLKKIQILTL